jgi:hypothetical protein
MDIMAAEGGCHAAPVWRMIGCIVNDSVPLL